VIIYLDMDGVLCNFDKAWNKNHIEKTHHNKPFDKSEFARQVREHDLFLTLETMPKFNVFISVMKELESLGCTIEMLSSLGCVDDTQLQKIICHQKTSWLLDRGIYWKRNFVSHKGKKKLFATPNSILIDDTQQNIWDFNERGGHGILYRDDDQHVCLEKLVGVVNSIFLRGEILT
jgi:hypothetical protein